MIKQQFIRINHKRYKLSTIKGYESFKQLQTEKYGIYLYFSALKPLTRSIHLFENEEMRDRYLNELDFIFNV